jgi:hypothetical protein
VCPLTGLPFKSTQTHTSGFANARLQCGLTSGRASGALSIAISTAPLPFVAASPRMTRVCDFTKPENHLRFVNSSSKLPVADFVVIGKHGIFRLRADHAGQNQFSTCASLKMTDLNSLVVAKSHRLPG